MKTQQARKHLHNPDHFAQEKCIYKLLSSTHSERGIKFDEVVCLGHQLVDGVFYVGMSTCSMQCNVFRAISSGWDFTYMGDGTFNICDRKINAITANVNALRNVNSWIAMAFVLQESCDYYAALYKVIVRACLALKKLNFCREPGECQLCDGQTTFLTRRPGKKDKNGLETESGR